MVFLIHIKHVISTCRLCHGTATSGYHKYVRLKMDGLLEPWQNFELWSVLWFLCMMCVVPVNIQFPLAKVYGVCIILCKQADTVHGYQQWQDMLAPDMSTTDDAWHTDTFSCWCCQIARYSLGCAQNCLGPTGLQRSLCKLGAKNPTWWWQSSLYGTVWAFLVSIGHVTLIKEGSFEAETWLITQNLKPEKGCVIENL